MAIMAQISHFQNLPFSTTDANCDKDLNAKQTSGMDSRLMWRIKIKTQMRETKMM